MERQLFYSGWRIEVWTGPHDGGGTFVETIAQAKNQSIAKAAFEATKLERPGSWLYLCNRARVIEVCQP